MQNNKKSKPKSAKQTKPRVQKPEQQSKKTGRVLTPPKPPGSELDWSYARVVRSSLPVVNGVNFNRPLFKDCDLAITMDNECMSPKIRIGDVLMCKKVNLYSIWYGEMYFVVGDSFKTVRYLRKHPTDETKLILGSADAWYQDVEIETAKILELYQVKGLIARLAM